MEIYWVYIGYIYTCVSDQLTTFIMIIMGMYSDGDVMRIELSDLLHHDISWGSGTFGETRQISTWPYRQEGGNCDLVLFSKVSTRFSLDRVLPRLGSHVVAVWVSDECIHETTEVLWMDHMDFPGDFWVKLGGG